MHSTRCPLAWFFVGVHGQEGLHVERGPLWDPSGEMLCLGGCDANVDLHDEERRGTEHHTLLSLPWCLRGDFPHISTLADPSRDLGIFSNLWASWCSNHLHLYANPVQSQEQLRHVHQVIRTSHRDPSQHPSDPELLEDDRGPGLATGEDSQLGVHVASEQYQWRADVYWQCSQELNREREFPLGPRDAISSSWFEFGDESRSAHCSSRRSWLWQEHSHADHLRRAIPGGWNSCTHQQTRDHRLLFTDSTYCWRHFEG